MTAKAQEGIQLLIKAIQGVVSNMSASSAGKDSRTDPNLATVPA
jgi:hypothetical protein